MPVGVVIELNEALATKKLAQIGSVSAFNILNAVGNRLQAYVAESFETKGRGQWAPLSWLTIATRPHGGSVPLQNTGRYKQSWIRESDGKTFVSVGSNLKVGEGIPLAAIHEFGTGVHGAGRGWYLIEVKNKRVLAARLNAPISWIDTRKKSGTKKNPGWIVFGKFVKHEGVPARPVLPTFAEGERIVRETAERLLGLDEE